MAADDFPPHDPVGLAHAAVDAIARGWGMVEAVYLWAATGTGAAAVIARRVWVRYRAGRDVTKEVTKLEERLGKIEAEVTSLRAEVTSAKKACETATGGVTALVQTIQANAAETTRWRGEVMDLLNTVLRRD